MFIPRILKLFTCCTSDPLLETGGSLHPFYPKSTISSLALFTAPLCEIVVFLPLWTRIVCILTDERRWCGQHLLDFWDCSHGCTLWTRGGRTLSPGVLRCSVTTVEEVWLTAWTVWGVWGSSEIILDAEMKTHTVVVILKVCEDWREGSVDGILYRSVISKANWRSRSAKMVSWCARRTSFSKDFIRIRWVSESRSHSVCRHQRLFRYRDNGGRLEVGGDSLLWEGHVKSINNNISWMIGRPFVCGQWFHQDQQLSHGHPKYDFSHLCCCFWQFCEGR